MTDKPLGLWSATCLVIASMVGAGVFVTSGYSMQALHTPGRVLAAWIVGGAIATCGAISYGALSRHITESGGEYLFLSRTVHPVVGFVAGWISLIAGFSGALAIAALTMETYAVAAQVRPAWLPAGSVAIAAIILCGAVHAAHVGKASGMQNAFVSLKLALLLGFVLIAVIDFLQDGWPGGEPVQNRDAIAGFSLPAFAGQLVWISLSYSGFNAAVYVAGEVRDARRNVPRAMLRATVAVALLYVVLNAIFLYAAPAEAIRNQGDVAAISAFWIGGQPLATTVRIIIVLGLFTSVSAMVQSGPRVYAKMAADGLFPRGLDFQHGPPRAAIVLQTAMAVGMVCIANIRELLSYLGFTLSLSAAATAATLFWLRRGAGERGEVSSGILVAAAFYVLATFSLGALAIYESPLQIVGTLVTIGSGLLVYWWMGSVLQKRRRRTETGP